MAARAARTAEDPKNRLSGAKIDALRLAEMIGKIWRLDHENEDVNDFESVVSSIEGLLSVHDNGQHIIRTFKQLYLLINKIRECQNSTRAELVPAIRQLCDDPLHEFHFRPEAMPENKANNSIDLAIEIWLLVRLRGDRTTGAVEQGGEAVYEWDEGQSIGDNIMRFFKPPDPETYRIRLLRTNGTIGQDHLDGFITKADDPPEPSRDRTFCPLFTLSDLETLGGFKIQYTSNLLHHLYLHKFRGGRFRATVFIFSHVTILSRLRDGDLSGNQQIRELFQETLDTLALLIPPGDADSQQWFKAQLASRKNRQPGDGTLLIDRNAGSQMEASRRVHDYRFWRTRLLLLEEEFNKSSPRTVSGWLRDRRNRREHAAFWAAIGAVIFAILALAFGILSAAYGIKSFNEAIKANEYASIASAAAAAETCSGVSGNLGAAFDTTTTGTMTMRHGPKLPSSTISGIFTSSQALIPRSSPLAPRHYEDFLAGTTETLGSESDANDSKLPFFSTEVDFATDPETPGLPRSLVPGSSSSTQHPVFDENDSAPTIAGIDPHSSPNLVASREPSGPSGSAVSRSESSTQGEVVSRATTASTFDSEKSAGTLSSTAASAIMASLKPATSGTLKSGAAISDNAESSTLRTKTRYGKHS